MKQFLQRHWPIILLIVLCLMVAWPTIAPGYFFHQDDLQVMRVFEMRKCLVDLQIPCRWVPDMGYGNGYPLFNYYGVLPYYIGAIASFVLGFLSAAKLLFVIPIFLGAIAMYLLAKEFFGLYPAILAAVLYTYAPYHALDLYVRGDIAESFATSLIVLTFYFVIRLIKEGKAKYQIGLSLSLAAFLISHNIMTVLFAPVVLTLVAYWSILNKRKNLSKIVFGLMIGVGLAAFFIIPAFFEKNLVQIDNLIRLDLNFRAHFVTVYELFFKRSWGYGASMPGPNDTISFQIGWPHWFLALAAILIFVLKLKSNHRFKDLFPFLLFMIFLAAIFMTHVRSAFIWEQIEILKFTQFPWRFLSVAVFAISLLGAYVLENIGQNYRKYALIFLLVITVGLNWSYFKPKEFYPNLTDAQKLSGALWDDQQKAAILDYLPQTAVRPYEPAQKNPLLLSGQAVVSDFQNKSNSWQFTAEVQNQAKIEVPVFDFPKWQVKVNDKVISYSNKNYLGRIDLSFAKSGSYHVIGVFKDTLIRQIANMITLISLVLLIVVTKYGKIYKNSQ